jgi:hypothetical protein
MMIQSIGVLQSYSALSQTKTGRLAGSSESAPGKSIADIYAGSEPEAEVKKSDSISVSVEGVTAYVNQALRDKALTELNRLLQLADGEAKPIEELDPAEHTPEKTSDFIVSMSTSFFDSYSEGHPELEQQGLLDGFIDVVSGGIKRGLEEARDLLEGLDVLNGLVEEGVDTTDSLIWEKLDQFYADKLSSFSSTEESVFADAA